MEENCEKIRKIWKKAKLNSEKICKIQRKSGLKCEMIWKIWKILKNNFFFKAINTACILFKFTLWPTVRGNNSVSEGITL